MYRPFTPIIYHVPKKFERFGNKMYRKEDLDILINKIRTHDKSKEIINRITLQKEMMDLERFIPSEYLFNSWQGQLNSARPQIEALISGKLTWGADLTPWEDPDSLLGIPTLFNHFELINELHTYLSYLLHHIKLPDYKKIIKKFKANEDDFMIDDQAMIGEISKLTPGIKRMMIELIESKMLDFKEADTAFRIVEKLNKFFGVPEIPEAPEVPAIK